MKKCSRCKEEKLLNNFGRRKNTKDGLHVWCKLCITEDTKNRKEYRKEYNLNNQENIKDYILLYYKKNKDKINKYNQNYYKENINLFKDYSKRKSKESIRLQNKKQTENGYKKNWSKKQYKDNPKYKISQILRIRFLDALKNKNNKFKSVVKLLGCTIKEFKLYIESLFLPEMKWDNWGEIWELDHILPCSKFDLAKPEEQEKCFHFLNHQPLFKTTKIA